MKTKTFSTVSLALLVSAFLFMNFTKKDTTMNESIYSYEVKTISGETKSMSEYKGKVMLIVNVASKCGFTPQYEGLETLHNQYGEKGLVVMGFPCNQFGSQEPGGSDEIKEFCTLNYGVNFQMMEKVEVNGDGAHPLYKFLKKEKKGTLGSTSIKWNFAKFLVDKNGKVIARYSSATKPEAIAKDIEALL